MSRESSLEEALQALRANRAALTEGRCDRFLAQLATLRKWQSDHVALFHQRRAAEHKGETLLHFLTRSFYLEADWSELTGGPERMASVVGRLISDDRPLVIAIRLQATADDLDAQVTQALLDDGSSFGPHAYVRAIRHVGRREDRVRQIGWIGEMVDLLGGYAANRTAYWAFRLAGPPARALGLGKTYELLAEGFSAMRQTRDLEAATREAVAAQRLMLDRLLPP